MGAHVDFIHRLADLVEYAENNDLEVASLALNAAVEVIAPSIARGIASRAASLSVAEISAKIAAPCAVGRAQRPELRLIVGGLGTATPPAQRRL